MNEYTTEERIYKLHVFKFRAKNVERMYILFILSGWSYGSMDQIGKQILYYLTLGGLGIWAIFGFHVPIIGLLVLVYMLWRDEKERKSDLMI
ncbi:MAG: hypothetical protein OXC03_02685 [Flavobacteriaceae bacterium]|nr:hypothetical protein [Flavobacteriaceae bacterium]